MKIITTKLTKKRIKNRYRKKFKLPYHLRKLILIKTIENNLQVGQSLNNKQTKLNNQKTKVL